MTNLRELFEYQKFKPNLRLQTKIDDVTRRYLLKGIELDDDVLDVSAAGDPYQSGVYLERQDEDKV